MKFLNEWKEILLMAGAIIAWIASQIWRGLDRKDKIEKDNFKEMKILKKLELNNKAYAVNQELSESSFEAMKNESEISKGLINICYKNNACYSQMIRLHNGGKHISEWSKKLVTMVAEERLPNVPETKENWQSVPLLPQFYALLEQAFTSPEKYLYFSNVKENMPNGEFKSLLDPTFCHDFALYWSGSAGSDVYFTMFQFRKNGIQSEREKIEIKQFSQSSGLKIFDSFLTQQTLKKKLGNVENELLALEDLNFKKFKKDV